VRRRWLWAAIAVVLLALNLRPAVVAMSPLLDTISAELQLSGLAAGFLVTLPVLCFGVLGPVAPVFARRWGMERTLAAALVFICLGSVLRLYPSAGALFSGTLLVGAGIAVGNILLPGLIKRDFPNRLGLMSGLYTMSLSGGATLAAGITIPVARAAGLEWNFALGAWGLFALLGLVVWLPQLRNVSLAAPLGRPVTQLRRDRIAWFVTIFFGLQSFNFYATTAWLPSIMIANGHDALSAGWMLSLINLVSIVPSLVVPMLLSRMRSQTSFALWLAVLYFIGIGGLTFALDAATVLWVVVLGVAQGSSLALAVTLIVLRAPDSEHATRLSRMAQSWGYLLAAVAPMLLGAIHDLTLAWTAPLVLLLIMLVPQGVTSYLAARPRFVGTVPRR
jgi:CP family cyanate transporter-like MFS transporter